MNYEITAQNISQYSDAIAAHLGETDSASTLDNRLLLKIDYSTQGQERFAKIYRIIDPEKKHTRNLTRTGITFKTVGAVDIKK